MGMSEMRSRFLDLVSQGYGDDLEMKYAARSLLESQISDDGDKMARALERMQAAHGRRKWLGWLVPLVLVLLGLSVFVSQAYPCYRLSKLTKGYGVFGVLVLSNNPGDWRGYSKELTEDEKLLLFGDVSCRDEVGRKKGFWDAEPGNAGAYIEYLAAHRMERGKYPEDMLETAAGIDAGNAFYYLLRAGEMAKDCTKKVSPTRSRSVRRSSRRGRRGKLAPKVKPPVSGSHGEEMMRRRLPLLRSDDHDWPSRIAPIAYLAGQYCSDSMIIAKVGSLVRAEAYRCEQEKDAVRLRKLVDMWMKYCHLVRQSGNSLVDALVLRTMIHSPCKDFAAAARECGMEDYALFFESLDQRLADEKDARERGVPSQASADFIEKYGSVLTGLSLPVLSKQLNDPSVIEEPDVRPDRLAEHAFFNRIGSVVYWQVLLVVAFVAWLWRLRSNRLLRIAGRQLAGVFCWRDWVVVGMWGIVLPAGIYWLVNGTETIVSAQRYNLGYAGMRIPLGQAAGLLLLLVFSPVLAVSVSMMLFGIAGEYDDGLGDSIKSVYALQAVALLLLLASPFVAMVRGFRDSRYTVAKAVRGHLVVSVYIAASLVMVLHAPVYHTLEKYWVAKDQVFKISPEFTAPTMYESQVTRQVFKELDELLGQVEEGGSDEW